jgi:hypothetical protein
MPLCHPTEVFLPSIGSSRNTRKRVTSTTLHSSSSSTCHLFRLVFSCTITCSTKLLCCLLREWNLRDFTIIVSTIWNWFKTTILGCFVQRWLMFFLVGVSFAQCSGAKIVSCDFLWFRAKSSQR